MKVHFKWRLSPKSKAKKSKQSSDSRCRGLIDNKAKQAPRRSLMDLPTEILLLIVEAYVEALDLERLAKVYYSELDRLIKMSLIGGLVDDDFTQGILNAQRFFWVDVWQKSHLHEAKRFMHNNIPHLIIRQADQIVKDYHMESGASWLAFGQFFSLRANAEFCYMIRHDFIRSWSVFLDNRTLWSVNFDRQHKNEPASRSRRIPWRTRSRKAEDERSWALSPKRAVYRSTLRSDQTYCHMLRTHVIKNVELPNLNTKWLKEARITRRHLQQQILDERKIFYRVPVTIAKDRAVEA